MSIKTSLLRSPLVRRSLRSALRRRTAEIVADITPALVAGATVVDIGAGGCQIAAELMRLGYTVTPLDVEDTSCIDGVHPVLFDGTVIPFGAKSFDVALLITVLHHTDNPDAILCEAARVARTIVIQEDIYDSAWRKYATYAMDSLVNLEFIGHPHSNRTDKGWRGTFERLGLQLRATRRKTFWGMFQSATYVVDCRG